LIETFEGLNLFQKPILDIWSQHTQYASNAELPFPNEVGIHPSANVTPLLGHRPDELHFFGTSITFEVGFDCSAKGYRASVV
jgi:hypothetical protein